MRSIIKAFTLLGSVLLALPFVAVVVCPPGRGAKAYRVESDVQVIRVTKKAEASGQPSGF